MTSSDSAGTPQAIEQVRDWIGNFAAAAGCDIKDMTPFTILLREAESAIALRSELQAAKERATAANLLLVECHDQLAAMNERAARMEEALRLYADELNQYADGGDAARRALSQQGAEEGGEG